MARSLHECLDKLGPINAFIKKRPGLDSVFVDLHQSIVARRRMIERTPFTVERRSSDHVWMKSRSRPGPTIGIFMKGGCDLSAAFAAAAFVRGRMRGTLCMYKEGIGIFDSRPDILLQTLTGWPQDHIAEVMKRTTSDILRHRGSWQQPVVGLPPGYFKPVLFEPRFSIPGNTRLGAFPKTVVVLSAGAALSRTAYRHREHGYLVDPGGWFHPGVIYDQSTVKWFKDRFRSVGRMTVEDFGESFAAVIRLVKQFTGAHVLVFNTLVVAPLNQVHNYQFIRNDRGRRRRDFDLALRDLSAQLDFQIVDVDRLSKLEGVSCQLDAGHFPNALIRAVGREVDRIFQELALYDR